MNLILKNIERISITLTLMLTLLAGSFLYVYASQTSEFQVVINPGALTIDIVDDSYVTVANPSVVFDDATFSFSCGSTTGTFGSSTQQLYIENTDSADDGWTVSIAASTTGALWDSAGSSAEFDFNDTTTAGCGDGGDSDNDAGRLTIDPSGATLATGTCPSCGLTGISLGSSNAFDEGGTDTITVVSAAAGSDDIGNWTVQDISLTQTLPAETPAYDDYAINMVLSIIGN